MQEYFKDYPLGAPIPDSVHAVCSSLPTMDSVEGYEEKRKDVMSVLRQGYPRFLEHRYVRSVAHELEKDCVNERVYAVSSRAAAEAMISFASLDGSVHNESGFSYVAAKRDSDAEAKASRFLQHTGFALSSREAEDWLYARGILTDCVDEKTEKGDASKIVRDHLSAYSGECSTWLTRSGMSAAYAGLQAAARVQLKQSRTIWIQLGWLYLDTQRLLETALPDTCECIKVHNVYDIVEIEALFKKHGSCIAGVVAEAPNNPLIQVPPLDKVREIALKHGAMCLYDPTLSSLGNLNLLPHCDLQLNSLTKYAGNQCDVMIGALMLNEESVHADSLRAELEGLVEAPYERDLRRLASQIGDWPSLLDSMNANARSMVDWLQSHPAIKRVHWACDEDSVDSYCRLGGSEDRPGAVVTVELKGSLRSFYDNTVFAKGPSFGTAFTLLCPFMYLAHYDLVSNEKGREYLRSIDIDPDLVRVSFGVEPLDAIKEEFDRALKLSLS